MGNPAVSLLVPAAHDDRPARDRRRAATCASRSAPAAPARAASRSASARTLPVGAGRARRRRRPAGDRPLERRRSPKLVLRQAAPAPPRPIEVIGEPRVRRRPAARAGPRPAERRGRDPARRAGAGALAARPAAARPGSPGCSATSSRPGEPVLAVTAHAPHRARALRATASAGSRSLLGGARGRSGARAAVHARRRGRPAHTPPAGPSGRGGWTHLAWGTPELDFALRIHEWDFALRDPLTALYRALRAAGMARGEAGRDAAPGRGAAAEVRGARGPPGAGPHGAGARRARSRRAGPRRWPSTRSAPRSSARPPSWPTSDGSRTDGNT